MGTGLQGSSSHNDAQSPSDTRLSQLGLWYDQEVERGRKQPKNICHTASPVISPQSALHNLIANLMVTLFKGPSEGVNKIIFPQMDLPYKPPDPFRDDSDDDIYLPIPGQFDKDKQKAEGAFCITKSSERLRLVI